MSVSGEEGRGVGRPQRHAQAARRKMLCTGTNERLEQRTAVVARQRSLSPLSCAVELSLSGSPEREGWWLRVWWCPRGAVSSYVVEDRRGRGSFSWRHPFFLRRTGPEGHKVNRAHHRTLLQVLTRGISCVPPPPGLLLLLIVESGIGWYHRIPHCLNYKKWYYN